MGTEAHVDAEDVVVGERGPAEAAHALEIREVCEQLPVHRERRHLRAGHSNSSWPLRQRE